MTVNHSFVNIFTGFVVITSLEFWNPDGVMVSGRPDFEGGDIDALPGALQLSGIYEARSGPAGNWQILEFPADTLTLYATDPAETTANTVAQLEAPISMLQLFMDNDLQTVYPILVYPVGTPIETGLGWSRLFVYKAFTPLPNQQPIRLG